MLPRARYRASDQSDQAIGHLADTDRTVKLMSCPLVHHDPDQLADNTFHRMMSDPIPVVLTVDAVITDAAGRILLMERGTEPFQSAWVLPGGIVEAGETLEEACAREVREEVGLQVRMERLIGVYSTPGRDPRGAFVSIAFHATITSGTLQVTEEARAHRWLEAGEELPMGFDHARIVADFLAQQGK